MSTTAVTPRAAAPARAVPVQAVPAPKSLGTIWIDCPNELLSAGLERMLKAHAAVVHRGRKSPAQAPSAVVCYADDPADAAPRVQTVLASFPSTTILILGPSVDLSLARAALGAGAGGVVHAGMPPGQIVHALSVAIAGEVVLPRGLLEELVDGDRPPDLSVLRPRQVEILGLVAEGLSNAQVAKRLYLSESTVKQHLRGAYKVLGVKNRNQAAAAFRRGG